MTGRILLVDDEEIVIRSCQRILREGDYEVDVAKDGLAALVEDDQVSSRPEYLAPHQGRAGAAAGDGLVRASADDAVLESTPTPELHEEGTVPTVDADIDAQGTDSGFYPAHSGRITPIT